jgi:alpha-L-fucosidase
VIDQFQPDLLYSDSDLPFGAVGMAAVAHLYNTSASLHGQNRAVYNQKNTNPNIFKVGVLDIERSQRNDIGEDPWQTDTSVGDWFYNVNDVYKTPTQVLETLVDIVSKNGNLVLNIPQKPDGELDDECTYLLKQMAVWMKRGEGEGIFASRPWNVSGEGLARFAQKATFEEKAVAWTPSDFRFTTNGDTLFAYQMAASEDGSGIIRSLALRSSGIVSAVRSLTGDKVTFNQTSEGLSFKVDSSPYFGPRGFAINFE